MMRFLHTADNHIDSPLQGLQQYEDAPRERLRRATRDAFERVVTLAIATPVDVVLCAGDLFDGAWRDMQTGLWTAAQFRRLRDAGIRLFLVRGNHDAASTMVQRLPWPDNVHVFEAAPPQTCHLESLGVAIHGCSFASKETSEDLAGSFPPPVEGAFNIGLLHTSLSGDAIHDAYAPCSLGVLTSHGYDYWALGHIHQRRVVAEEPHVVFPGNTQGRNVRETGAKGCYFVEVADGCVQSIQFEPTDVARWAHVTIEAPPEADPETIIELCRQRLGEAVADAQQRLLAVRVTLTGQSSLVGHWVDAAAREQLVSMLRDAANDIGDVWLEKVISEIEPPRSTQETLAHHEILGEILGTIDAIRPEIEDSDPEQTPRLVQETLAPLFRKQRDALQKAGVSIDDDQAWRSWLAQAERLLVARLTTRSQ